MGFTVVGGSEFRAALKATADRTKVATRKATSTGAHLIEADTKKVMGRYAHPKGTRTNAPAGGPPAVVSGQLRRSVKVTGPRSLGGGTYEAKIGPTAAYGRIQELGGEIWTGARLPARPYLAPTVAALIKSGRLRDVYIAAWSGSFSSTRMF